jgi:hypothetical protein
MAHRPIPRSTRPAARWPLAPLLAMALAGCDLSAVVNLSAEDKINAAFPVSEAVRNASAALRDLVPETQHKVVDAQFDARLKVRALTCAKGYTPSWLASAETIRKQLDNPSCFQEADAQTVRWLGLRRAGAILAQPALKEVPASPPAFIVASAPIQSVRFAESAGIALIETQQTIEVTDFESLQPLFSESKASGRVGNLSANGRLFTSSDNARGTRIRETESGAVLAEMASVQPQNFFWLDSHTALYYTDASQTPARAVLVDLASGHEVPIPALSTAGGFQHVAREPGSNNQFVLFTYRGMTKIELLRDKAEPAIRMLAEKPVSAANWQGPTADGSRYVSASRQLTLASLKTLETEVVPWEPFHLQAAVPTPDPDKIIVSGFSAGGAGDGPRDYVYSITRRAAAQIDAAKLLSRRYVHVPTLRSQAVIAENKIAILSDLPTMAEVPLDRLVGDAVEVANQRKLEAFARQQAQQAGTFGRFGASESARGAVAGGTEYGSSMALAARDAQVEAIGVYQGRPTGSRTSDGHRLGVVEVRIRRTSRPLILVLSSYDPVRWLLVPEPGARLAGVLLSGYHPSQVFGAEPARVIVSGSAYAYKLGSAEFNTLNRDVTMRLGKGIGTFQGGYEGATFSVGG